jgi:hypothetical protein
MTDRWGWQPTARMRDGLPTWSWRAAPAGLVTRRQMRAQGLAPGGAQPVARVTCRRGRRQAYLYDPGELVAKRVATPAQLGAVAKAVRARRWCPSGAHYADYCIPTSLGECVECHYGEPATSETATESVESVEPAGAVAGAGIAAGAPADAAQERGGLAGEAVSRARDSVWRARTAAHDTGRFDAGEADQGWRRDSAGGDDLTDSRTDGGLVHEEVA